MPENYVSNQTEKGNVSIAEDVICVMVSAAMAEVEGVAGASGSAAVANDIADFLGIKSSGKNIKISSKDGKTVVDIVLLVRYGYNVTSVAKKVQESVYASLEAMTGMDMAVNVHVAGIAFEKAEKK